MRAVGYCRVSSEEQVLEGFSLDTQKKELEEYCKSNDIDLIQVYIDAGVSAFHNALKDRPQGKFLLDHIYNMDIDAIIAISDDRIFRSVEDSIVVNNFALKNNVKLIYTRQLHYNTMDQYSSFLVSNMNAIMNQAYSMQYALKVKKGLINKIKKGEWNGKSPYGYDLVNSHLQINEEESKIIKVIFNMYLEGKGGELICNYLNENKVKPPKGNYWSKTSILCMLKNEAYTGTTIFNKRAPVGSGKKYNDESEWVIMENTHTPIIDKEDFLKVRDMMSKRQKNTGSNNIDRTITSLAPLSGLVFCEHCHALYIPTSGRSKKRGKITYYGCGSRRRNGKSVCSTHLIPSELLEKFVLYRVREILTSDLYKKHFEEQLQRELDLLESKKKDITKIKNDISKLNTQKEKLLSLIISEEDNDLIIVYKEKLQDIISQISFQNESLEIYKSIDISEEEKSIRKQFNLSCEDVTYKDFQELSQAQLKVLFNYLIDHIDIREIDALDKKRVILAISIHLKLDGYAPKNTLEFLKNIRTGEEKDKTKSKQKSCLPLDGGEGEI